MKFNLKPEDDNEDNLNSNTQGKFINNNSSDKELEFNKKNREDFENLMSESSTQLDGYWDINNPFVKLFFLILAIIIALGSVYYIWTYFGTR